MVKDRNVLEVCAYLKLSTFWATGSQRLSVCWEDLASIVPSLPSLPWYLVLTTRIDTDLPISFQLFLMWDSKMSTDIQRYNLSEKNINSQVLKPQFEEGSEGSHWALSPAEFQSVFYWLLWRHLNSLPQRHQTDSPIFSNNIEVNCIDFQFRATWG